MRFLEDLARALAAMSELSKDPKVMIHVEEKTQNQESLKARQLES